MRMGVMARGVALAVLALAGACSTMPSERAAPPLMPTAWRDAPVGATAALTDWWKQFNDPVLDHLVAEALTQGPSVQLAALRVQEARAQSRTTVAAYLPQLDAIGRGNFSETVDGQVQTFPGASGAGETQQMTGSYGAQVSWEVPLFGRIASARAGARANNASALADARGAQVALVADVAQAYVDLRAAQSRYASLSESFEVVNRLADILDTSTRAGITSAADAADARRLAETARAGLAPLAIEQRRAENTLAVLRGLAPGTEAPAIAAELARLEQVPVLPISEAPAAPADLLRLRPDIARAEALVLLAAASLGDARNNLLPQLNITGAITVSDNLIGQPLPQRLTQVSATPVLSIPLFDWGQRLAQVEVRDSQFHQRLIEYRQTVTQGVAEGSNALAALDQGSKRLTAARAAETAAEATARGRRAAYDAGIESLSDRLRADQQLIEARLARINAEADQARAAIAVYRAFGGGPAVTIR